jgi:hypothetical protein
MDNRANFSVFIVHYSKLYSRKVRLKAILRQSGIQAIWVTEKNLLNFGISSLSERTIVGVSSKKFGMDLGVTARSLKFSRRRARFQGYVLFLRSFLSKNKRYITGSIPPSEQLKPQWLEVQRMHLSCLVQGIDNQPDWILVLEDDAIPNEIAFEKVNNIVNGLKPHKTWINLNSGAGLLRTKTDPKPDANGLFQIKPAATRCAVAYLISRDLAKEIVESAYIEGIPNWLPIDFYYQLMLRKFKARSYWQDPPTFTQGSENGIFLSNFAKFRS